MGKAINNPAHPTDRRDELLRDLAHNRNLTNEFEMEKTVREKLIAGTWTGRVIRTTGKGARPKTWTGAPTPPAGPPPDIGVVPPPTPASPPTGRGTQFNADSTSDFPALGVPSIATRKKNREFRPMVGTLVRSPDGTEAERAVTLEVDVRAEGGVRGGRG